MPNYVLENAIHNLNCMGDAYAVGLGLPLIPLTLVEGERKCDLKGYHPPLGVNVVIKTFEHEELLHGEVIEVVASFEDPQRVSRVAFLVLVKDKPRVFFISQVSGWQIDECRPSLLKTNRGL